MQQLHGSGKTTVLVERIVSKIINEKVDIDKLLIVTFTKAAASEMKERILDAIYKKIEENPNDIHLQKQLILLNKANISTIHSFCLDIIKNYFYEIDVSPKVRLADTSEIQLLKMEVIEELFENLYEKGKKYFIDLVNTYGGYRDDENLKNLILNIYNYIQSTPYPEEWLHFQIEKSNLKDTLNEDFKNNIWGQIIIDSFLEDIKTCIKKLKQAKSILEKDEDSKKCLEIILEDIFNLEQMLAKDNGWEEIYNLINTITFTRWQSPKKNFSENKALAKEIRDNVKKIVKEKQEKFFIFNSKEANYDIYEMYPVLQSLEKIILQFSSKYSESKKEKEIIDYSDIEHYALNILKRKDNEGKYTTTEIAKKYQEKFVEIAIDEYQDSNLVQEEILTSVSTGRNIFMVGDVKQSIYKFRQARPELFLSKYDKYSEAVQSTNIVGSDTKIKLFENFRSRRNIVDFINLVFSTIMNKITGGIDYNQGEYLNVGKDYEHPKQEINYGGKIELHIINKSNEEQEYAEEQEKNEEEAELIEDSGLEARLIANKIKEIFDSNYCIYDKKLGEYRKATFKDIVILLRTPSKVATNYEKELLLYNFPVYTDVSSNYFDEIEIQIMISVLKIIDNPDNDIALVSVLRSYIGDFDDNELLEIKLNCKDKSYYKCLKNASIQIPNKDLQSKINNFLKTLEDWQEKQDYYKLDELIWYIYESTGLYNYVSLMKNGNIKTANLKKLFETAKQFQKSSFQGLYNFINYIDKISKKSGDISSAKMIGENENVIRIMSIHKSKGLEFPIVFLAGVGKQFNMQDLNEKIVLHQDIGIGAEYINYEKKIRYTTLAKEAIKLQMRSEVVDEEMRILYVALTRAKEKLIITGIEKGKHQADDIRNAKTYIEWLKIICEQQSGQLSEILEIKQYLKSDFIKENQNLTDESKNIKIEGSNCSNEISELLNWKYPKEDLTKIEGKSSVSKISKKTDNMQYTLKTPLFMQENLELTKAEIGTAMHLVLQKLDFFENYNINKVKELINKLVMQKIITEKQAESVDTKSILGFTKSDLFNRIKTSKEIHKEQPFYINLPAKEIYHNDIKEEILIQGIIDIYFIDIDGKIVLIDYKTDYVKENEEETLKNKYSKQLALYKEALGKSLKREVKEVYIYSTYLGISVQLDI